jgi:hypothetical protein
MINLATVRHQFVISQGGHRLRMRAGSLPETTSLPVVERLVQLKGEVSLVGNYYLDLVVSDSTSILFPFLSCCLQDHHNVKSQKTIFYGRFPSGNITGR